MALQNFYVTTDKSAATPRVDGVDAMVVVAETAADAKAIAKSLVDGDSNALWAAATATVMTGAADMAGWTMSVRMVKPDGSTRMNLTVVGLAAATLDTIAALMVIALNATADIANAAYNAGTQVLTIASIADGLGDHTVVVTIKPPVASYPNAQPIPGLVGAIVQGGIAGAVLTVTLAADAYTIPNVVASCKQK